MDYKNTVLKENDNIKCNKNVEKYRKKNCLNSTKMKNMIRSYLQTIKSCYNEVTSKTFQRFFYSRVLKFQSQF